MGDIDLLDMAAYALDPANSDTGTLIAVACVLVGASGLAVLWVHKRLSRRPTVEEWADTAFNPSLDHSEARLRAVLHAEDDNDGLIVPPPGWWKR